MARSDTVNISSSMRNANFRNVLDEIWTTEGVNRASIARRTGLSSTTISDIVNELIGLGVVEEIGAGESRGGRRPILLEPVADARTVVGVEAGASHVEVVLMNLVGEVQATAGAPHGVPDDVDGTVDLIESLIERCLGDGGITRDRLLGVGLAVSSPLDGEDLRHVSAMTMPAWKNVDVVQTLEDRLGLPVRMDNDANLGAVAEQWWGSGRGCDDFTYIKLDVGVGAGHIIGGELYRGSGGTAGEVGHINIGGNDTCRCGRVGCVEMQVGSTSVVARYAEAADETGITIEDVIERCQNGDELAVAHIAMAGETLGKVLAPILNLLNPGKLILSGPLAAAGDVFLDAVSASVGERALPKSTEEASIVLSSLRHLTVAIGAATAALEVVFDGGAAAWHRPMERVSA